MEASGQQSVFRRTEEFEIDNTKYIEVIVDGTRMTCRGPKWRTFEILLSFIGAALMEKQRRFGVIMVIAGIALAVLGFFGILSFSGYMGYLYSGSMLLFGMAPFFAGIALIVVWMVTKRESLRIYTPSKDFRVEGPAGFIDDSGVALGRISSTAVPIRTRTERLCY